MDELLNDSPGTALAPSQPAKGALVYGSRGFQIKSLDDAWRFANYVIKSGLAVKGDTPEAVIIKMQLGAEVGLDPMAAIQSIAVINGRPGLWGDGQLGVCQSSRLFDWDKFKEWYDGEGDNLTAHCEVGRKGSDHTFSQQFSVADAKRAGLWGKGGPWTQYPRRMLQWRARSYALRDAFADVLRGMKSAEELYDMVDVQAREVTATSQPALPAQSATDALAGKLAAQRQQTAQQTAQTEQPAQTTQTTKPTQPAGEPPAASGPSQAVPTATQPAPKRGPGRPPKSKPASQVPPAPPPEQDPLSPQYVGDKTAPEAQGAPDPTQSQGEAPPTQPAAQDQAESAGLEVGLDAGEPETPQNGMDAEAELTLKRQLWKDAAGLMAEVRRLTISDPAMLTTYNGRQSDAIQRRGIRGKKSGDECSIDALTGVIEDFKGLIAEIRGRAK